MSTHSPGPEWSGDMLESPAMTEAFASQLRAVLRGQADFVARVRRDAEAMWKANPPAGYGTFEVWWRHRWVTGPFAEIQEHLEKAATLTFELEARYRKGRHEIPAARQAAALAKKNGQQAAAVPPGTPPRPVQAPGAPAAGGGFLDLIRNESA